MRSKATAALMVGILCTAGCGGGGGVNSSSTGGTNGGSGSGANGTSSGNVQSVVVDSGPTEVAKSNSPAVNTLYTQVTVCVPGTSTCQTIDHVQVDTGSSGLRIISSALTLAGLPAQQDQTGTPIAECVQFADGSSWGPLRVADVKISGETARNQTLQVIGDPAYSTVPTGCGGTAENTVTAFGANGILGIGPFIQDCGAGCADTATNVYYTCATASSCTSSAIPLALQTSNPASFFATDNNGIIIELPAVASTASSVTGSLIFGIGTQSNNDLGTAQVIMLNTNDGSFVATYKGTSLTGSFIDSGSNALYFSDATIQTCDQAYTNTNAPGFFCPANTLNLSATVTGTNNVTQQVNFGVGNAQSMFSGPSVVAVAPILAGSIDRVNPNDQKLNPSDTFDFGLPFYYGRSVYTAFETRNTSAGLGPYFAF